MRVHLSYIDHGCALDISRLLTLFEHPQFFSFDTLIIRFRPILRNMWNLVSPYKKYSHYLFVKIFFILVMLRKILSNEIKKDNYPPPFISCHGNTLDTQINEHKIDSLTTQDCKLIFTRNSVLSKKQTMLFSCKHISRTHRRITNLMQTILVHLQVNTSESERTIATIEDTIEQPLRPTQLSQISLPKTTHELA